MTVIFFEISFLSGFETQLILVFLVAIVHLLVGKVDYICMSLAPLTAKVGRWRFTGTNSRSIGEEKKKKKRQAGAVDLDSFG